MVLVGSICCLQQEVQLAVRRDSRDSLVHILQLDGHLFFRQLLCAGLAPSKCCVCVWWWWGGGGGGGGVTYQPGAMYGHIWIFHLQLNLTCKREDMLCHLLSCTGRNGCLCQA